MEEAERKEVAAATSPSQNDTKALTASTARLASEMAAPAPCATCAAAPVANNGTAANPVWIYAVGRVAPRFPKLSVEKEFAQALGRDGAAGLTDRQVFHAALSKPENRYLLRQLCWVMTIEGLETYILVPRDPADIGLLVETLRPTPHAGDLDCLIGIRGPVASPEMCNGLMIPIVVFDQIYSFDRDSLIKAIPKPEKTAAKEFVPAAEELFDRIMQMTDNAGATDEHRAVNYLAVRYPGIYTAVAESFGRNESLTSVEVRPSPLSGMRKVLEVIFAFTHRNTDVVTKSRVCVDVTEEFPFLVKKLTPWYDR